MFVYCALYSRTYSVQVKNDKPPSTSAATPTSLTSIPLSSSDDKLDGSTCPSRCIPVNGSDTAAETSTSLRRHGNNSVVVSRSSSFKPSQTNAAYAVRHHNTRHPFTGFCRCRDLGLLRVCQRCPAWKRQPTSRIINV